jgi:GTP-binding protein
MSQPIVAIVGRPNVGKSTLFNRIIGQRKAIVDDQPGITRDRNYETTDWAGRQFALIDTGGYLPEAKELMEVAIREQVEIAVDEADLIVFVADSRTGITDVDQQIAQILLRSGKATLLVINKIDDLRDEAEVGQFYKLGLGEPVAVSAMTGRQSGDLLDVITSRLKKCEVHDKEDDRIRLAVIGRENVGKSSLVNRICEQNRAIVTDIPGTTRDPIDTLFRYQKREYLLIDTAGLKKKAKVKENILFYSNLRTWRSIQRADVVLYMVDVYDGITRQDLSVLDEAAKLRRGIVLLFNKWDLIEKDDKTIKTFQRMADERLGHLKFIPQIYVSVLEKQRLLKALDLATQVYEERRKRVTTSVLNDYFLPLIQQFSPPATHGKEIKINYVTQLQANPPLFAFYSNNPKLIPDSYKRFLENKLREQFGFAGVPLLISFRKK